MTGFQAADVKKEKSQPFQASPESHLYFLILQVNGQGKMDGVDFLVSVEQQHEEASY